MRKLCSHWDSLEVQDGVLYCRWEDDNGASTRLPSTGKARKAGPRAPLVNCVPGYTLERVAIDILGPLPEPKSATSTSWWSPTISVNGQRVTLYPTKRRGQWHRSSWTSLSVDLTPRKLSIKDEGPNFESSLFQEMCDLLGVEKTRTTSYHPEGDGMVERFNRTQEAML